MFEVDELFDLTKEGAFATLQEFKDFSAEASLEDIYSILKPGAFQNPEELNSLLKKKDVSDSVTEDGLLESPTTTTETTSPTLNLEAEESSEAMKKIKANSARLASGIARIPMYVAENAIGIASMFDEELEYELQKMTPEQRELTIGAMAGSAGMQSPIDVAATALAQPGNKLAQKLRKTAEDLEQTMIQYDTGVAEDIFSENFGQGFSRLMNEAVGALPSLALAVAPGGIALIGAGAAAEKSRELQEKGDDLNFSTLINAAGSGVAEGVFEGVTRGLGKTLFKSLAGKTKDQALQSMSKVLMGVLKGFGAEGSSETATLISQKALDAYVSNDEEAFNNIISEGLDTFIIGGVIGAPLGGLSPGIRSIAQGRQRKSLNKIIEKSEYKNMVDAFSIERGNKTIDISKLDIIEAPNSKLFLEGTLEGQVKNNTITETDAKKILDNYDQVSSLKYQLSGLNLTPEQQTKVIPLLSEKQELESLIEGKDKSLVRKEQNRIDQIDKQIEIISDQTTRADAIKVLFEEGGENVEITTEKINEKLDELIKKQQDANTIESPTEVLNEKQSDVGEAVVEGDNQPTELAGETTQAQDETPLQPTQEGEAEVEISEEQIAQGTLKDNIGEKAYKDGKEGMIKIDKENLNTIVFETNDEIINLGRLDLDGSNLIANEGLNLMPPEGVDVTKLEEASDVVTSEGVEYKILGRRRDKKGEAVVRLKEVKTGLERRFVGAKAERILKDESLRPVKDKTRVPLAQEERLSDNQVPKEVEVFDVKNINDDSVTIEVITYLDGSRLVKMITEDGMSKETVSKDNPLSNKDYVTKAYGAIEGSKSKPVAEVLSQKKIDRLSTRQKEAVGLEQKTTKQPKTKLQKQIDKSLTPPVKKVTVNEKAALKDQIRLEAKAAKNADLDAKGKVLQLTNAIKNLAKEGKITTKQASAVINKIGKSIGNKKKTEALLDYAGKVFDDANYAENLSKTSVAKGKAIDNLNRGALGENPILTSSLARLLNIPLESLSIEQLVKYNEFISQYATKRGPIKLKDAVTASNQAKEIMDSLKPEQIIDEQSEKTIKEKESTKKIADKINSSDINGDQLIEDNKEFIENNLDKIDTPTLYNLVDKLNASKNKENEAIVKAVNDYAKVRQDLIDDIAKSKIDYKKVSDLAQESADFYNDINKKDLINLSGSQLEQIQIEIDNINNGSFTYRANQLVNTINANRATKEIVPIVSKLNENLASRAMTVVYGKIKSALPTQRRTPIENIVRSNPLSVIDDVYGNFKGRQIFDNLFEPMGRQLSKFQAEMSKINTAVRGIEKDIAKTKGETDADAVKRRFSITYYLLKKEFESNDTQKNKGIADPSEFADKTIESFKANKFQSRYEQPTINVIEDLNNDLKGKTSEEIYKTFSPKTKTAIAKLQKLYQENQLKADYAARIVRGENIDMVNNYVHHYVAATETSLKADASNLMEGYDMTLPPSARSKVAQGRTEGAKPIEFDPLGSFLRSARETNMDYFVANQLMIGNKTANQVVEQAADTEGESIYLEGGAIALKNSYQAAMNVVIGNNFINESGIDKFLNKARELGYYAALSSVPRAAGELTSNLAYVAVANPQEFLSGMSNDLRSFTLNKNDEGLKIARNLGSKSFSRLFGEEKLTGSKAENAGRVRDKLSPARVKGKVGERVQKVTDKIPERIKDLPIEIAEKLISSPDKAVSRPLFFGALKNKFKELTGQEIDFNKIQNNDKDYLIQNKKALNEATKHADSVVQKAASSVNPMEIILKNQIDPKDKTSLKIYKNINSYMSKFSINEYSTARQSVASMMGNGEMTREQGLRTLIAVNLRMGAYLIVGDAARRLMYDVVNNFIDMGDEEEERDYAEMAGKVTFGSAVSLLSRRTLGNVPMIPINIMIEKINESYGQDLRGGKEYDAYRDGLVFSQINMDRAQQNLSKELFFATSGPYRPYTVMGLEIAEATFSYINADTDKKKNKALEKLLSFRIAAQAAGNLGLLPFYKDILSAIKTKQYRDFSKKSEKKNKVRAFTKDDLKRFKNNPAMTKIIKQQMKLEKDRQAMIKKAQARLKR